jgi:hypothetical protein
VDPSTAGRRGRRPAALLAPNRYVVDWISQHCANRIGELIEELCRRRRHRKSCSRSARRRLPPGVVAPRLDAAPA